jgi:hypothetical protein
VFLKCTRGIGELSHARISRWRNRALLCVILCGSVSSGYFLVFFGYDDFLDPLMELLMVVAFINAAIVFYIVCLTIWEALINAQSISLMPIIKNSILVMVVFVACTVLSWYLWSLVKVYYNPVG